MSTEIPIQIKSPQVQRLEAQYGQSIHAILSGLFAELGTREAVAVRLGVSLSTVQNWADRYGVQVRLRRSLAAAR